MVTNLLMLLLLKFLYLGRKKKRDSIHKMCVKFFGAVYLDTLNQFK